ncbi:MAG: hypothetical protein ACFE0Q_18895 [Anaerolineae bacterium]
MIVTQGYDLSRYPEYLGDDDVALSVPNNPNPNPNPACPDNDDDDGRDSSPSDDDGNDSDSGDNDEGDEGEGEEDLPGSEYWQGWYLTSINEYIEY